MNSKWYIDGLHFECLGCGGCCSGPGEGYIWVTRQEVKLIAEFLKISEKQLRQKYMRRVGWRTTIIEQPANKDCMFLWEVDDRRGCVIYPVRPSQCRMWPFWSDNLASPTSWNKAAKRCPGVNRGRAYSFEEIKKIRNNKKWWLDGEKTTNSSKK